MSEEQQTDRAERNAARRKRLADIKDRIAKRKEARKEVAK